MSLIQLHTPSPSLFSASKKKSSIKRTILGKNGLRKPIALLAMTVLLTAWLENHWERCVVMHDTECIWLLAKVLTPRRSSRRLSRISAAPHDKETSPLRLEPVCISLWVGSQAFTYLQVKIKRRRSSAQPALEGLSRRYKAPSVFTPIAENDSDSGEFPVKKVGRTKRKVQTMPFLLKWSDGWYRQMSVVRLVSFYWWILYILLSLLGSLGFFTGRRQWLGR